MVKPRAKDVKPKRVNDFKKKTAKVGKHVKRSNTTTISVSSKRIAMPTQHLSSAQQEDEHSKLTKIASQIHHHNSTNRTAAINELKQILLSSKQVDSHIAITLPSALELLFDTEKSTRSALLELVSNVFTICSPSSFTSIAGIITTYCCSGLTSLDKSIRQDSLILLLIISHSKASSILLPDTYKLLDRVFSIILETSHSGIGSDPNAQTKKVNTNLITSSSETKVDKIAKRSHNFKELQTKAESKTSAVKSAYANNKIVSSILSKISSTTASSTSRYQNLPHFLTIALHTVYSLLSLLPNMNNSLHSKNDNAKALNSMNVNHNIRKRNITMMSNESNNFSDVVSTSSIYAFANKMIERISYLWKNLMNDKSSLVQSDISIVCRVLVNILTNIIRTTPISSAYLSKIFTKDEIYKYVFNMSSMLHQILEYFPYTSQNAILSEPNSMAESNFKKDVIILNFAICELCFSWKLLISSEDSKHLQSSSEFMVSIRVINSHMSESIANNILSGNSIIHPARQYVHSCMSDMSLTFRRTLDINNGNSSVIEGNTYLLEWIFTSDYLQNIFHCIECDIRLLNLSNPNNSLHHVKDSNNNELSIYDIINNLCVLLDSSIRLYVIGKVTRNIIITCLDCVTNAMMDDLFWNQYLNDIYESYVDNSTRNNMDLILRLIANSLCNVPQSIHGMLLQSSSQEVVGVTKSQQDSASAIDSNIGYYKSTKIWYDVENGPWGKLLYGSANALMSMFNRWVHIDNVTASSILQMLENLILRNITSHENTLFYHCDDNLRLMYLDLWITASVVVTDDLHVYSAKIKNIVSVLFSLFEISYSEKFKVLFDHFIYMFKYRYELKNPDVVLNVSEIILSALFNYFSSLNSNSTTIDRFSSLLNICIEHIGTRNIQCGWGYEEYFNYVNNTIVMSLDQFEKNCSNAIDKCNDFEQLKKDHRSYSDTLILNSYPIIMIAQKILSYFSPSEDLLRNNNQSHILYQHASHNMRICLNFKDAKECIILLLQKLSSAVKVGLCSSLQTELINLMFQSSGDSADYLFNFSEFSKKRIRSSNCFETYVAALCTVRGAITGSETSTTAISDMSDFHDMIKSNTIPLSTYEFNLFEVFCKHLLSSLESVSTTNKVLSIDDIVLLSTEVVSICQCIYETYHLYKSCTLKNQYFPTVNLSEMDHVLKSCILKMDTLISVIDTCRESKTMNKNQLHVHIEAWKRYCVDLVRLLDENA